MTTITDPFTPPATTSGLSDGNGFVSRETSAVLTDRYGNTFDDTQHETGPDGSPRLTADGFLYRKVGRRRREPDLTAPAPRKAAPASRAKDTGTDYRPGLMGIAQLTAGVLSMVSPLDAQVMVDHGPGIVEALNETAKTNPGLASLLDKIVSMGPWGLVIAAVVPAAAQVAVNHGWLPSEIAPALGIRTRAQQRVVVYGEQSGDGASHTA